MKKSKARVTPMREWNAIPWHKLERRVFKLQKRIFRAKQRGDVKAVHRLQKMLISSWSAKCLSVRRVTQDNQGKKTAGVDGVKSLSPEARLTLVGQLKLSSMAASTRRVWIPKPGRQEKRPLGIPTMYERTRMTLVKMAMEPEWEAVFEPNSYGARPGRSCHDAIEQIFAAIKQKEKYVLDADIAQCFDRINHQALLNKLNTYPILRRQIRAWLKAGVIEGRQWFETSEGTPQGGTVSPLLANIALHGLETRIKEAFPLRRITIGGKRHRIATPDVIRYCDDFVILHEDLTVVQRCQGIVSEWLKGIGLELKPSKTRISHTLNRYEDCDPEFEFLGFSVRQFPVGKHQSGKLNGKLLGFKTIITPSQGKQKVHYDQLASIINAHKSAPQSALIRHLNPVIRGWAKYYSTVVSKETFSRLDHLMYQKLKTWAKHRHPGKSWEWVASKYWQTVGRDNWVFATRATRPKIEQLLKHRQTSIVRYVKVKSDVSPYNGNLIYWSSRKGKYPEAPKRVSTLLKRQKGKCACCGMFFREEDLLEIDHIIPKSRGGLDEYKNLQLLHRHCHDTKTAKENCSEVGRYA